ncbi:MAG: HlyC/CorC family transporter [Gammaproteobacteria bacterium]|nr:HlyC/CorC family transporter [Gammaproteobacteria bacterium]
MDTISVGTLFLLLSILLLLSAWFSGTETALMSVNRYRLRHKARAGHQGAILVLRLLERPDRLIGLILLGNCAANLSAPIVTTLIAQQLFPEQVSLAVSIAAVLLIIVVLIFSEVLPKTFAALHPEKLSYIAAYVYTPLLKIMYVFVWFINLIVNGILRTLGIQSSNNDINLSKEELHTVVKEASALLSTRHQAMLISILNLENATVEDIMVPRNEVIGIDLNDNWSEILEQLNHFPHTRLPVYRNSIDNIIGMLHVKRIVHLLAEHRDEDLNKNVLETAVTETYFIPEGTSLMQQLVNFQKQKRRIGLVVDEYGDLLGLVTLEDILEEIVGKFTTDTVSSNKDILSQIDGSYLIDGGTHVRDINAYLNISLPTDDAKTLNGLILEHLEMIPEPGTSLLINECPIEIIKAQNNTVKLARLSPSKAQSIQANRKNGSPSSL